MGGRTHERGKGKQSARRGRKNQLVAEGLRARFHDLDPISRTPYGPAANERRTKRPDIRQYLTRLPPTRFGNQACSQRGVHIWLLRHHLRWPPALRPAQARQRRSRRGCDRSAGPHHRAAPAGMALAEDPAPGRFGVCPRGFCWPGARTTGWTTSSAWPGFAAGQEDRLGAGGRLGRSRSPRPAGTPVHGVPLRHADELVAPAPGRREGGTPARQGRIGARVSVSVRRVKVAMDSAHPSAAAFEQVHARLRG